MKIDQFPTEQQHPVFVFGTLRPGHGNSRTWQGVAHPAHDGEATIADHRLVTNGGFPYCLPAEGETTTGTLIVPFPENYELAMHYMDGLEGYPLHYNRKTIEVTTPLGTVTAWYYIPDDWSYYANLAPVPGNDWNKRGPRRDPLAMREPSWSSYEDWAESRAQEEMETR